MNGSILPDTPIAVDFWNIRQRPHLKIFFLSHMHADHTKGLSASWRRPVYCSPVTARLLPAKLHVPASLVKPIEVGETHIIPLDKTGQETMTVSLIDANHCPGAVMFLFEGYFGRILYTGDFRYEPSMVSNSIISSCGSVDRLYLDNTYNNPQCVWPSRAECTAKIIDIISQYPAYEVVIGLAKLGKEELLVEIALAFQTRIVVNPDRLQTLKILEMRDVFSTDSSCSRIRVVPRHLVTRKNVNNWQEGAPTIAILPTALYTSLELQPFAHHPDIYVVPYSDHSSHSELVEFVSRIKPKSITPIVGASKFGIGNENMAVFDKFLDNSTCDNSSISIPASVLSFMNSSSTTTHRIIPSFNDSGVKMQPRKPISSSANRLKRFKDLAKGVVFNDSVDEDVTEEMERRKECDPQRCHNLSPAVASDREDDNAINEHITEEVKRKKEYKQQQKQNHNPSLSIALDCYSDKDTYTTCLKEHDQQFYEITKSIESREQSLDVTVQQPCGRYSSKLNGASIPDKKKTDVLTMLRSYASRRAAPLKDSNKPDNVNLTEAFRNNSACCNKTSLLHNITSTTGEDNQKNGEGVLFYRPLITKSSTVLESAIQTSTSHKHLCHRIDVKNNSLQECSEGNMLSINMVDNKSAKYTACTSVAKSRVSSSPLLVLPCSVTPVNRKRKREEKSPSLTKMLKQFCK